MPLLPCKPSNLFNLALLCSLGRSSRNSLSYNNFQIGIRPVPAFVKIHPANARIAGRAHLGRIVEFIDENGGGPRCTASKARQR